MKVIRAGVLGFCMGVRRAVDLACAEAAHAAGSGKVFTLGPLIHNPRVLEELERQGVGFLENLPADLSGISVIIRAHGVSPITEQEIHSRGGRVVDATCPRVKAGQLKAGSLERAGYRLFLAGEAGHAEVLGIKGYAPGCFVVGNAGEARAAAAGLRVTEPDARTALIGQTTIRAEEYRSVADTIKEYFPRLEVVESICAATRDRQDSLRSLLDQVDAVVIAGGKESANTRRLFAIAEQREKPCVLAEAAGDIPAAFAAFQTVGLCAGASTPDSVIDEIEAALTEMNCG